MQNRRVSCIRLYRFDVSNIFNILMKTEVEEEYEEDRKGKDKEGNKEDRPDDKEEEEIEGEVVVLRPTKICITTERTYIAIIT